MIHSRVSLIDWSRICVKGSEGVWVLDTARRVST